MTVHCEVTDKCRTIPRYRVRARVRQGVTLVIDTCRRHLAVAAEQGLTHSTVRISRIEQ